MRLDSNLSRPRAPNGQSAQARRHLSTEEQYDRWAAARQHARRHSHGEMTATAAAAAAAREKQGTNETFSPPRASALCYANSLDFVQFFCSDAIESDDEDDGDANSKANNNNNSDMLTITRSLAFGGSIDTDDDDNHNHEGRMISLASNTFESTKSDVSELQVRLDNDLRISDNGDSKNNNGPSDNANTPLKLSSSSRQSSGDVTPYASNKKVASAGTPTTCDVTPPRSNSSSLQSTPISRQDLPRKRLELGSAAAAAAAAGGHIPPKSSKTNVEMVDGHIVAETNANGNGGAGADADADPDEPQESGTELVLVHMSKSAAVL